MQLTPRLIPAGPQACEVGPLESLTPQSPQPIAIAPVLIGIANAGNGVAIIDAAGAAAFLRREGDPRPISILTPPALAPGAAAVIKLTRDPVEGPEIVAGDRYEVSIPYRGEASSSGSWLLRFAARYFPSHWEIEDLLPPA